MARRSIVPLGRDRVDEAAALLSRAFANDPLQRYVFPESAECARLSPLHFAPLIGAGLLAGEVWTTDGSIDAVAVWWPPSRPLDSAPFEQAGFFDLPGRIGVEPFRRFTSVVDCVERVHDRSISGPHWYALVLGVDPSLHGQGLGGDLLAPVFARADAARIPCYLETFEPRNIGFYRKHGFAVIAQGTEPDSGLAYWAFRRDPRDA